MPSEKHHEHGAAEMIGVLMLIAIFAVAAAVLAVFFFSHSGPEKTPAVKLVIINDTRTINIFHEGGDTLNRSDVHFYVYTSNGSRSLVDFSGMGDDAAWSVGESLDYTISSPDDAMPVKVDVVYTGAQWRGTTGYLLASIGLDNMTSVAREHKYYNFYITKDTGCTISPSDVYSIHEGNSQAFSFGTSGTSYELTDVRINGVSQGIIPSYTFTNVNTDNSIYLECTGSTVTTYWINVTNSSGGSISPGNQTVADGGFKNYTFTPYTGYMIASVVVNGMQQTPVPSYYNFTNVNSNQTLDVEFTGKYLPGIIGTYYHDRQWSLLPVTKIHPRVRFANAESVLNYAGSGSVTDVTDWAAPYISQQNNFSASYNGLLHIEVADSNYKFMIRGCNGYYLSINDVVYINSLGTPSSGTAAFSSPYNTTTSSISLTPGYYNFSARMWGNSGTATPVEIGIYYTNTSKTVMTPVINFNHTPLTTPVADFSGSPLTGTAPLSVTFTDASADATSWTWDFGDGSNVSYEQNPVHNYTAAGQYTVSLIASNSFGYDTKTRSAYVSVGTSDSCIPGLFATYYSNATWADPGATRTDARIRYADGWYSYDPTDETNWPLSMLASKEYFSVTWDGYTRVNTTDTYTFNLTSDDGAYLWVDDNLIIDNGGLHVALSKTGTAALSPGWHHITVKFYEYTERAIVSLQFHPSNTTVYQYVSDSCHVEYSPPPEADFSATPLTGNAPLSVAFTDLSTNSPTSWFWDFGDGNTTGNSLKNPVHLYEDEGPYSVYLTATNSGGSDTSVTKTITVGPPLPVVTAITPTSGPNGGGTTVTITGNYLSGVTLVKFGTTNATTFTINSDTEIVATSPAHSSGVVDITATSPAGTSATSSADQFTYGTPTVTSVSPAAGPTTGGTTVIITGTDLTGATAVRFGTRSASSFTVLSATSIRAISPNYGTSDTVDITVTTPLGTSATSSADLYTFGRPAVTSITPKVGPIAGGTTVTIAGAGFTGVTAVRFGATAATTYTVNSDTQITATSPARSAGTIDITVTTPAGTSSTSSADRFTYVAVPTVTRVLPTAGTTGTSVTITGTGFSGTGYTTTGVMFGSTAATTFSVISSTSITATAPAGSGTIDIRVTTVGGTSATSSADQFTYVVVPAVTSISPAAGPINTRNTVTITGTGFTGVTSVRFGGVNARSYTVNSATSITAVSERTAASTVDITVTNAAGTSPISYADKYTFGAPTVTARSPTNGPAAGGTTVTITGTGYTGVTSVRFGTRAATSYTVNSATSITATSPANSAGTIVDITVITPAGTSATSAADRFTYY